MRKDEQKVEPSKTFLWACGLLITVNISLVGYTASLLHGLDVRISVIEGNRWTAKDGALVFDRIAKINSALSKLPDEIPPTWFREIVAENRSRIKELEKRAATK